MPPALTLPALAARKAELLATSNDLREKICAEASTFSPIATSLDVGFSVYRQLSRLATPPPAPASPESRSSLLARLQTGFQLLRTGWEIYNLFQSQKNRPEH